MHIDLQILIAAGMGVHLLAAMARSLWKAPKRQAQVDAIEAKLDAVLGVLQSAVKP